MTMLKSVDRLKADLVSLDAILASLPAFDPLGHLSLEAYREELLDALDDASAQADHAARVEITLGGEPIAGGVGIHAGFLADAVGGLQDLLTRICGTRGNAHLFVTGLSHQPSGVVLQEVDEAGDLLFPSRLRHAVADAIHLVDQLAHDTEADFADLVDTLEPRLLKAARDFIGRVCRHDGTFRLSQGDEAVSVDHGALEQSWRRL